MKLFILSDIHGSYPNLQKALARYQTSKADYLVLLGDLLYHGPRNDLPEGYDTKACFALLNQYAENIIAVRGNCDSEVDQMVLDFDIKEDYSFLTLKDRLVYLTHGHIYSPEKLPPGFGEDDVLAFGHTHTAIAEKRDNYYIFNPGSCSLAKTGELSYGIIDNEGLTIYNLDGNILHSLHF